jgi:hypothetical protein
MKLRAGGASLLLILCASASDAFADTPPSPSVELFQRLKQVYDNGRFLQEAFYSEENLKSFFDASSLDWVIKEGDPPHVGRIAVIRSRLMPDADIRVSRLIRPVGKGNPAGTSVIINVLQIARTQAEVEAVFGTPNEWTRRHDSKGERTAKTFYYGDDLDWLLHPPPGAGVTRKTVSFSTFDDGSVRRMSLMGFSSE